MGIRPAAFGLEAALQMSTPQDLAIRAIRSDMGAFHEQCEEVYLDLGKGDTSSLRQVNAPSLDGWNIQLEDFESSGALQNDAAIIDMTMLYEASLARYDLLRLIHAVAREFSKWTKACHRRLQRLVSYLHHTQDRSLGGFVLNAAGICVVIVSSDAGVADDARTAKSTSGSPIAIAGPISFMLLFAKPVFLTAARRAKLSLWNRRFAPRREHLIQLHW